MKSGVKTVVNTADINRIRQDKDNKEKIKKEIPQKYGEYKNVFFTNEQFEQLKMFFPKDYAERIQKLDDYIQSSGKKYKDCLATIKNWARKEGYNFNVVKKEDYKEVELTEEEYMQKLENGGKRYV